MTPSHIAFIMDGNGRWAERRHMPRKYGHKMGTQTLENVVELAAKYEVKTVTFYAFSTENWTRPQSEIDYLFGIFRKFLKEIDKYKNKNVKLRFIGNLNGLPEDVADACREMTEKTKDNDGLNVVVALNYGSWEEVTTAVNRLCLPVKLLSQKMTSLMRFIRKVFRFQILLCVPVGKSASATSFCCNPPMRNWFLPTFCGLILMKKRLSTCLTSIRPASESTEV